MAAAHTVTQSMERGGALEMQAKRIREQRRYEISKAVMAGLAFNSNVQGWTAQEWAEEAVTCADALLAELEK